MPLGDPWHVQEFVGRLGALLATATAGTGSHSAFASCKEPSQGAVDFEAGLTRPVHVRAEQLPRQGQGPVKRSEPSSISRQARELLATCNPAPS